jgi:hypothetical protein
MRFLAPPYDMDIEPLTKPADLSVILSCIACHHPTYNPLAYALSTHPNTPLPLQVQ